MKCVCVTENGKVKTDGNVKPLWDTISSCIENDLNYHCEFIDFNKLDFQEHETLNKFLTADIVLMDVTNTQKRPVFMYHKGTRESIGYTEDIVLIEASAENDAIQDLKTTCKIKRLIVYRYDEAQRIFYDTTATSTSQRIALLRTNLRASLEAASTIVQKSSSDRYIALMNDRRHAINDTTLYKEFLWNEICNDVFTNKMQEYATPALVLNLIYAFRDIQDYESIIQVIERCKQLDVIWTKLADNPMIAYLTAFAYSRRNAPGDRDRALEILEKSSTTKKTENEQSNDAICLCGRIYKDKFTESDCRDKDSLTKAIAIAGINLLTLLCIAGEDPKTSNEAYKIIMKLNALLGKKGALRDLADYWDVATYFELHVVQQEWVKANQAALHMYLLNPPVWYMKSTFFNLKLLHDAIIIRDDRSKNTKESNGKIQSSTNSKNKTMASEEAFSFWIEFFDDAVQSGQSSANYLPASMPILICDNYEKKSGVLQTHVYLEAYLQLNFHTDPETLVIRVLNKSDNPPATPDIPEARSGVKTIEMQSIRSVINVKRDARSVFLHAYENVETFSSLELQIYFSSAERRTAFNEKIGKTKSETDDVETNQDLN
ncbi:unnamed protein product, partial [Didymodactylos carnosus]